LNEPTLGLLADILKSFLQIVDDASPADPEKEVSPWRSLPDYPGVEVCPVMLGVVVRVPKCSNHQTLVRVANLSVEEAVTKLRGMLDDWKEREAKGLREEELYSRVSRAAVDVLALGAQ
jgi:hypothetical protein